METVLETYFSAKEKSTLLATSFRHERMLMDDVWKSENFRLVVRRICKSGTVRLDFGAGNSRLWGQHSVGFLAKYKRVIFESRRYNVDVIAS